MGALAVVPPLDVLKDILAGLLPALVVSAVHPLLLQSGKEALHRGIIPTVSLAAHAAVDLLLLQQPLIVANTNKGRRADGKAGLNKILPVV